MADRSDILEFAGAIAQEFHPERIILFGSHAYGDPRPGSDVDLLVVMPFEGHPIDQSLEILRRLKPSFSIDLLVRTPDELRRRLDWDDFFLQEIIRRGTVLHEASHA